MTRFVLTPGKAGANYSTSGFGGGGGGILVNGEKPSDESLVDGGVNFGEGFGGGSWANYIGLPGYVLIEV